MSSAVSANWDASRAWSRGKCGLQSDCSLSIPFLKPQNMAKPRSRFSEAIWLNSKSFAVDTPFKENGYTFYQQVLPWNLSHNWNVIQSLTVTGI